MEFRRPKSGTIAVLAVALASMYRPQASKLSSGETTALLGELK